MKNENQKSQHPAFLRSAFARHWKRLGARRRSGVATPLFSVYSRRSAGIGEIPDLELLAEWASSAGLSLIQLLPMNDVGFNFRPYDAESSFAIEPMYLNLDRLEGVNARKFRPAVEKLRVRFAPNTLRVDYAVKKAKLDLLWAMFLERPSKKDAAFDAFRKSAHFWLDAYAQYRCLKEKFGGLSWLDWPDEALRNRRPEALQKLEAEAADRLEFYRWLQWQAFTQFARAKKTARAKGVYLMGDLPFLVSRDSTDVWAHPHYFKLDRAAGAPPDLCFSGGQRWGMPPYDWERLKLAGYDYLIEKLRAMEPCYDLFRVDHFVGIFRVWTFPLQGDEGRFDPPEEAVWEEHGRRILAVMAERSPLLPCAEDLGTVPPCSPKVLAEFCIPGMEVMRWTRDEGMFRDPQLYRRNATAVLSTHDTSPFSVWWQFEAGTVEEAVLREKCRSRGIDFERLRKVWFEDGISSDGRISWKDGVGNREAFLKALGKPEEEAKDFLEIYRDSYGERQRFFKFLGLKGEPDRKASRALVEAALRKVNASASVFSVQLLQDWLSLEGLERTDPRGFRINFPGTVSDANWTMRLPFSLEKLLKLPATKLIRKINQDTGRA